MGKPSTTFQSSPCVPIRRLWLPLSWFGTAFLPAVAPCCVRLGETLRQPRRGAVGGASFMSEKNPRTPHDRPTTARSTHLFLRGVRGTMETADSFEERRNRRECVIDRGCRAGASEIKLTRKPFSVEFQKQFVQREKCASNAVRMRTSDGSRWLSTPRQRPLPWLPAACESNRGHVFTNRPCVRRRVPATRQDSPQLAQCGGWRSWPRPRRKRMALLQINVLPFQPFNLCAA